MKAPKAGVSFDPIVPLARLSFACFRCFVVLSLYGRSVEVLHLAHVGTLCWMLSNHSESNCDVYEQSPNVIAENKVEQINLLLSDFR